jgi:hypothetical protein
MSDGGVHGPAGETYEQRTARHWTWLHLHAPTLHPQIREQYELHGRGYWQVAYGQDPIFRYFPAARANAEVAPYVESYDPARQFVLVIKDQDGTVSVAKMSILRISPAGEG